MGSLKVIHQLLVQAGSISLRPPVHDVNNEGGVEPSRQKITEYFNRDVLRLLQLCEHAQMFGVVDLEPEDMNGEAARLLEATMADGPGRRRVVRETFTLNRWSTYPARVFHRRWISGRNGQKVRARTYPGDLVLFFSNVPEEVFSILAPCTYIYFAPDVKKQLGSAATRYIDQYLKLHKGGLVMLVNPDEITLFAGQDYRETVFEMVRSLPGLDSHLHSEQHGTATSQSDEVANILWKYGKSLG